MSKRAVKPRPRGAAAYRIRRRRLLLWSLPVVILALLVSAKLVSQHIIANTAIGQYHDDEFEASLNLGGLNQQVNVVERWKTPYLEGTNYLRLDALDEAHDALEDALALAAPHEQCPIRENLAIVHERAGDLARERGEEETAVAEYKQALTYLEERDPSCDESSSARAIADSIPRIKAKLDPPEQQQEPEPTQPQEEETPSPSTPQPSTPEPSPSPDENEQDGPDQDRLDELEEDMENNQREREDDQDYFGGGGGGSSPDRPW